MCTGCMHVMIFYPTPVYHLIRLFIEAMLKSIAFLNQEQQ